MDTPQLEIILKAWGAYQDLTKGMGENCWKIRSVFYTVTAGLVAAGYSASKCEIYLFILPISVCFLILELGYRRLQQQYIAKLVDIERTINDFLANEPAPHFPTDGVSTGLHTPTLRDLCSMLVAKRFLLWSPYLVTCAIAAAMFFMQLGQGPQHQVCPPLANTPMNADKGP